MTTTAMSAAQLLQVSEPEFDTAVQAMTLKDLLEMITVLQKEMSREQENFNSLSTDLGGLKRNSGQYKSVSKDMNASQTRLTMLMNRSMKCFSQQTNQQGGQRRNSQGSAGGRVQRSNSAHEKVETAQAVKANVSKPNRNSVASVLDVKNDRQQATPLTNGNKPGSKKETQSGMAQVRPLRPVSNQLNRTSVEVKAIKTDSENLKEPSSVNFTEAKSKLKSVFDSQDKGPTENRNFNTQLNVSSNVNRSQTFAGADTNRMSNGIQYDVNKTEITVEKADSNVKKDSKESEDLAVNGNHSVANETVKVIVNNNPVKANMNVGPMASQKKFISTSTGNLNADRSNIDKPKPEVVKGLQSTKPKSVLVMNADKQMVDLDSFTTRKNMLAEIKQFDKELKHTKTRDSRETKLTEIGSMSGGSYKVAEKKSDQSVSKNKLMDDIKQSKKPSEIKSTKDDSLVVKDVNLVNKDGRKSDNKPAAAAVDATLSKEQKELSATENKQINETKIASNIEIKVEKSSEVSSQMQKFDDLLDSVDGAETVSSETNVQHEDLPGVAVINEPRATLPEPEDKNIIQKGQVTPRLDSSEASKQDVSDDEKYVTKFQFEQPKVKVETQTKPLKKEAPVIVPKDVQVTAAVSAPPVKVQGQQEQITQNSKVVANDDEEEEEEVAQQARINLIDWDPSALLEDLYKVQMMPDTTVDISHKFIGMEGLMEKLPMNKKKATLLKTWKRRFFRAADGWLHYYETSNRDKPSDSLQLMGGKVEELGPRVLGVDDGRGKYLMVRVPTDQEYGQWKVALDSQTADNVKATYVTPVPVSPPHPKKKVLIIDVGSSSIRAGILGEKPTLPQVFFPTIVAVNKQTGELTVGIDAYKPAVRKFSNIVQPIRPTNKVDKFNMDMEVMPEIFKKVFRDLQINPREFLVMLSTPQSLGDKLKGSLMKILLEQFQLRGVCMVPQALLALYSYNSTSGIIVDIGERMEILPIYDGLLIEGGVSRQAYGGAKVQDSLYLSLLQNKYKFNTTVEKLLVRHICEEACYVAMDYKEATTKCEKDPESFKTTVYLSNYSLPEGAYMTVDLDNGCFKSPEGFFHTDLWGMDYPNIHKLIYQGIQQSPMDARKHMYRSVYLSGGVTMIPRFAERLEQELKKLAPPTVTVEVHAAPQRYHAAYIGACAVASMDVFEQSCVSVEEWKKLGLKACRKWGTG